MVDVPEAIAVTTPVPLTATLLLSADQVPPAEASFQLVVAPTHIAFHPPDRGATHGAPIIKTSYEASELPQLLATL